MLIGLEPSFTMTNRAGHDQAGLEIASEFSRGSDSVAVCEAPLAARASYLFREPLRHGEKIAVRRTIDDLLHGLKKISRHVFRERLNGKSRFLRGTLTRRCIHPFGVRDEFYAQTRRVLK